MRPLREGRRLSPGLTFRRTAARAGGVVTGRSCRESPREQGRVGRVTARGGPGPVPGCGTSHAILTAASGLYPLLNIRLETLRGLAAWSHESVFGRFLGKKCQGEAEAGVYKRLSRTEIPSTGLCNSMCSGNVVIKWVDEDSLGTKLLQELVSTESPDFGVWLPPLAAPV